MEHVCRINTLQDEAEQAVSALKNERPNMNLTAFLSWLEENKERLNSHLYGPIVKEVKLADRKFASMFEKQVRPEDLLVRVLLRIKFQSSLVEYILEFASISHSLLASFHRALSLRTQRMRRCFVKLQLSSKSSSTKLTFGMERLNAR